MRDFVFRYFTAKNKILAMAGFLSFVLIGSVYYGLNVYFDRASHEVVENWYANELTSIQQGNVLSSVTKLQRTLEKSALVKGVRVVDSFGRELVRFGKIPEFELQKKLTSDLSQENIGLFIKAYGFKSDELSVFVITESRWLLVLVAVLASYLIVVTFGFAIFILKSSLKEERLRAEVTINKVRLEGEFNERIANLSRKVAHDIRSPLSAINIISDKMKSTYPEEGMLLGEVSRRIIQIADGLLDISRVAQNDLRQEPIIIVDSVLGEMDTGEVKSLCHLIISEKKILFKETGIKLQVYDESESLFSVVSHSSDLYRIISNLLNNAIESIEGSGFVSLTVSDRIEGILIEIRDSGRGMSDDLIEKVMRGSVTEGKIQGNGLGLWPAIETVKAWGGSIKISSGSGTTVSIFLKKLA